MYLRSFLCEGAKIKQRTPLKKELCEIGEEAIWESRFTSFFIMRKCVENCGPRHPPKRVTQAGRQQIFKFTLYI